MLISSAYAQTASAAATPESGGPLGPFTNILPFVLVIVVMYFIMIRPQMKRQKDHRAMVDALAKDDEVVTAGGILGTVTRLSENALHLEIAKGVEVQVQRSYVTQVLPRGTIK